ncbi:MAG: dienelactone hydrolase family protein [Acidocella sp.]|jgi:dienelactone hydrolase|nr:dienelactone hydrolase family protein [Acidocella sp.]
MNKSSRIYWLPSIMLLATIFLTRTLANAQTEFPPPQGKGPVVVVISGQMGANADWPMAKQIAAMGYDAVLLDGNNMEGDKGQSLHNQIMQAQQAQHGMPGKVAVAGFSLGGGLALFYASHWPDLVNGIVAWYPLTTPIKDAPKFVSTVKVPILMFAGVQDTYKSCCLIATAQAIAAAATQANAPITVVTYPNAQHDFITEGEHYDPADSTDSWQRATAALAGYFKQQ